MSEKNQEIHCKKQGKRTINNKSNKTIGNEKNFKKSANFS
ncbi:hypothetical protein RV09_GL003203 [Enterococcus moraviensis]|nr:hypothetical protein RV09_GL003203 [Enterococcus moraviensis]